MLAAGVQRKQRIDSFGKDFSVLDLDPTSNQSEGSSTPRPTLNLPAPTADLARLSYVKELVLKPVKDFYDAKMTHWPGQQYQDKYLVVNRSGRLYEHTYFAYHTYEKHVCDEGNTCCVGEVVQQSGTIRERGVSSIHVANYFKKELVHIQLPMVRESRPLGSQVCGCCSQSHPGLVVDSPACVTDSNGRFLGSVMT